MASQKIILSSENAFYNLPKYEETTKREFAQPKALDEVIPLQAQLHLKVLRTARNNKHIITKEFKRPADFPRDKYYSPHASRLPSAIRAEVVNTINDTFS